MKMSDILTKINLRNKYSEVSELVETCKKETTLSEILDFASKVTQDAEEIFNLTIEEGDLIYYNILTALKHLKNYPTE